MALTNRYSCLARRDFLHTENRFHIHYMEEGHVQTPLKFRSRSNGRIKSYGPYEPLLLPGATRHPPLRVSIPHPLYRNGHAETPVKFRSRSNGRIKSYGPYEPLLLPGSTRDPPHRVSIPHTLYGKRASRNSCKIWIAIQRSDQKLWPLQTGTLAWRDETFSTPRIDSTSTIWKKGIRKVLLNLDRDPTVGSKVMALTNR